MLKKAMSFLLVLSMVFVLSACGTSGTAKNNSSSQAGSAGKAASTPAAKHVDIILTNGKGEIDSQFQKLAQEFNSSHPNITLKVYSQAVGDTVTPFDKLTASGKTVTIPMFDPGTLESKYSDLPIDLSSEKWVSQTDFSIKNKQGQVIGFPFAVEGFGLIYNQKVVEKALGTSSFDPFSINTRDKLQALLDKVQQSGIAKPVAYQTESWSVGNHYSTMFLDQASDPNTIIDKLKQGNFDLMKNADWNGYYDTLEMLISKKYNVYGERPLGKYYDQAHVLVGQGKAGFIFNGDWAYDSLKAVAGDYFGFMPVPVDNNPKNPLNNKIPVGATQVLIINKKATPDQQAAAKTFLSWLVDSQQGQDFLVNQAQVISPFKNNPNKVKNPLGVAIANAIAKNETMPFSTNYIDTSSWDATIAPLIQKYVGGAESRAQLATAIEDYFKKQK